MTFSRFSAAALLMFAVPLSAAVRLHAISPLAEVIVSGVVRDASTGAPVGGAIVHSGTSFSNQNGTGPDGKYSLSLPANRPTLLTVDHFAYQSQTITFTPIKDATVDFSLTTPRPAVTVKLTSGETHVLDLGTSQFAYLIPFSGYARYDNANFCKPDGSAFAPAKTEFARILGPATSVNFSGCCTLGPVMIVNVEMKSGERTAAYFNDSCFGNEVDFIGRERSSGQYLYFNFANIAEIDFP